MRLDATLGWEIVTTEERLVISKVDTSHSAPDVKYSLLIQRNFTWRVSVKEHVQHCRCMLLLKYLSQDQIQQRMLNPDC